MPVDVYKKCHQPSNRGPMLGCVLPTFPGSQTGFWIRPNLCFRKPGMPIWCKVQVFAEKWLNLPPMLLELVGADSTKVDCDLSVAVLPPKNNHIGIVSMGGWRWVQKTKEVK